eukprot:GILI01016755.1.p2 GENE.GILI01016755.1~~GILI01016755.1.p2  ORF type:complete len:145 (+),score=40.65 GILI01016755.1:74-508(+)
MAFATALVLLALAILLVAIYKTVWDKKFFQAPQPFNLKEKVELPSEFTLQTLRQWNGTGGRPTLVALKGRVYDVSSSGFYGPGSNYNCFAGREASIALAKMSFEEDDLQSSDLASLTPDQQKALDQWVAKFEEKYPVVGRVVDN